MASKNTVFFTTKECRNFAPVFWDAFKDEYNKVTFDNCKADQEAIVEQMHSLEIPSCAHLIKKPYRKLAVLLRAYEMAASCNTPFDKPIPNAVVDDYHGAYVIRFKKELRMIP